MYIRQTLRSLKGHLPKLALNDQGKLRRDMCGELVLMVVHEVRIGDDNHGDCIGIYIQDSASCYEINVRIISEKQMV